MGVPAGYDFGGYATKYNILCSDGRTILPSFGDKQDRQVPLVDNHNHKTLGGVIGHMIFEPRKDGLYGYGYLNTDTEGGRHAKALLAHGDINSMSIWANALKQKRGQVEHGDIKEVSLVIGGANKGAKIDFYGPNLSHSEFDDPDLDEIFEEVVIHSDYGFELPDEEETNPQNNYKEKQEESEMPDTIQHADTDMTIEEWYEGLDENDRNCVDYLVGLAVQNKGGDDEMGHSGFNLFEGDYDDMQQDGVLSHSDLCEYMEKVFDDMKHGLMLRDALKHEGVEYGIQNIDVLFPEAALVNEGPEIINRDQEWVGEIMAGVHKFPMARVRMEFADITEEDARARGYIKGKFKKEEVFSLLKRAIEPKTVYKKQKVDRDDMIDIRKDFNLIPWLKAEMRLKLNEELARAYIFGDGRDSFSDDKIDETKIIPVVNDHDFFVLRYGIAGDPTTAAFAETFVDSAVMAREGYKGSGNTVMFVSETVLTRMLLLKDTNKHRLYKSVSELATAMMVDRIVTVPYLGEGIKDKDGRDIYAVILNLDDYGVGTDKGGEINTFDDFDIDLNQYKYLMETRCSGALRKPFSAIVLRKNTTTGSEAPNFRTVVDSMKPQKPGSGQQGTD